MVQWEWRSPGAPVSRIAHLAPLPGSTISSALGLSFSHCRRRETFQRLDAAAGAVAHFQRAIMMDIDQAAKAVRDEEMNAEIEDFLEGFNQPTFRGMRVNGVRVHTWSTQHRWSGL
jgi:hypothetical protein